MPQRPLALLICLCAVRWSLLLPRAHADAAPAGPPARGEAAVTNVVHWAFQPVRAVRPPAVRDRRWIRTDVDRFILARLETAGKAPGLPMRKRAWLRRVTYDLTGLPPTPAEMDAFLRDGSAAAEATVVERLLGSPHYGERWGRHWLDLVRYADTAGDSADYPIPEAQKYRDYVLASFNEDKPYDRFLQEQIAGDLLPAEDVAQWRSQIIATGFIALSRRFGAGSESPPHLTIEDTLDTMGRAILGLSLSCARCHDHKYDPVSMQDYYALYGIFASTRYPHPGSEQRKYQTNFVPLIALTELEALGRPYLDKLEALDRQLAQLEREIAALPDGQRAATEAARARTLQARMDLRSHAPQIDAAYAVSEDTPINARIQQRGDPNILGEQVPRGFLRILGGQRLPAECQASGRLELSQWLTAADNPLTARVMVNRLWQHHFGTGLVETPSDFGTRGRPPTDPDLLDYLAAQFMREHWSIKAMHRLMVLSAAYALEGSAPAPRRRRLDAEEIRDTLLAVSGELEPAPAEPHPFPPSWTWEFTQHTPFQAVYGSRQRSVYLMQQRLKRHPFLALFDGADPNASTAARPATITPLQALFSMNDRLAHEWAHKFAERLIRERATSRDRIDWAHQLAFGRPADPEELKEGLAYLQALRRRLSEPISAEEAELQAWASYARALLGSNELFFVD